MMKTLMMRLGAVMSGSNADLGPGPQDSEKPGGGGSGTSDDEKSEDGETEAGGDKSENEDDDSDDGEGSDGESDDTDTDADESDGDGDGDEESDDEDGKSGDSDDDGGDHDADEKAESADSEDREAGGHDHDKSESTIADSLMDAMSEGEGTDLSDNNAALSDALQDECEQDCLPEEQIWRPYQPSLDVVQYVRARNEIKAKRLQNQVKPEIAFLTNKLRSKFLQARSPEVVHGVRRGVELSDRRLVDSMAELKSGRRPTRPDWARVNKPECSLAAALVLDQSGSMAGDEANVARGALAIATPLDKLGCPCLVVGPRNGEYCHDVGDDYYNYTTREDGSRVRDYRGPTSPFHRSSGVVIDVFKDWHESMRKALPRFSSVKATGGTPLSDGIQYAMQELSKRPERHRVILVLTDGHPNCGAVVNRQIRLAKEAGVTIVGVGISSGCYAVTRQFPENHVAVSRVADLPKNMLAVLGQIMFPNRGGKKIQLDGKLTAAAR